MNDTAQTETNDARSTSSANSTESVIKLFNEIKWWAVSLGALAAILTLSKYLWVIGHPELLLSSIGNMQNLFIWLTHTFLVLAALLCMISFPSVVLSGAIIPFNLNQRNQARLTNRFCVIIWIGFIWVTANLAASTWIEIPIWLTFGGAFSLSVVGSYWALLFTKHARERHIRKNITDRGQGWLKRGVYVYAPMIVIGALLCLTSLGGVIPAQNTLSAWRGAESGLEAWQALFYCTISMCISILPAYALHAMPEIAGKRLIKAGLALATVLFLTLLMLPAVLDIWVYATANMLKIRDERISTYLIDPKEYPRSTFNSNLWMVMDTDSPEKVFSIQAFKLYELGDVLLLCPARYRATKLKNISNFTSKCFKTSSSKVKIAPPLIKGTSKNLAPTQSNCVSREKFTNPPMKPNNTETCIFHHLL